MRRGVIILLLLFSGSAALVHHLVSTRRARGWRTLHTGLARGGDSGGLQGLLNARVGAVRLAVAEPHNTEIVAELAFLNALLAHSYGLDTVTAAEEVLKGLAGRSAAGPAAAGAAAARALLALERGDLEAAERLAIAGAAHDREDIRPLLVRVRVRALTGDLVGASKLAEAASVKQPGAGALRVLWAEARLEAGQPEAAADVLQAVLARTPDQPWARLLLVEAVIGLGREPDAQLERALALTCSAEAKNSPVLQAACAVQAGSKARLLGDRAVALRHALEVANSRVREPRILARAAQLLAELGEIDGAEVLVERASRTARPSMPALVWARLAIALGRGESAAPIGLRPGHPETRLLAARAALVAGGRRGLRKALAANPAVERDPDLRALARLASDGKPVDEPPRPPRIPPSSPTSTACGPGWPAISRAPRSCSGAPCPDTGAPVGRPVSTWRSCGCCGGSPDRSWMPCGQPTASAST